MTKPIDTYQEAARAHIAASIALDQAKQAAHDANIAFVSTQHDLDAAQAAWFDSLKPQVV